jgi:hypothetical protein
MPTRATAAALPAALIGLLALVLAGCATEQEAATPEQWSGRHFYPPEVCLGVYARRYDQAENYWHMRRWCDQREMQSDMFL